MSRRDALAVAAVAAWCTLLVGAVLLPFAAPGMLAHRDMLVLDSPALSAGAFGFGDLPARNAPQDGLLALAGLVLPASWLARGILALGTVAGAGGAVALVRHVGGGPVAAAAGATLTLLNPAMVERLLQGQWSLAVAGWLLPAIAWAGLSGRTGLAWAGMVPAALTPTGAVLGGLVGGLTVRRGGAKAAGAKTSGDAPLTWALAGALCLPWLVPAAWAALSGAGTGTATAASAAAFAPRAEAHLGTGGTLLSLGGIWNAGAAPDSRAAGFGLFGLALTLLCLLGRRAVARPLWAAAAVGLVIPLVAWLVPGWFAWAVATVPGAGLVRDAHKFVLLAVPALVAALGGLSRLGTKERWAWLALVLAVVQALDFPAALRRLAPVPDPTPAAVKEISDGRDVLVAGSTGLVEVDGVPTVDYRDKALPTVASGQLVVDGVTVDAPSARWSAADQAWRAGDLDALADLGVGWVIDSDGEVLAQTPAPAAPAWPKVAGVVLIVLWAAAAPAAWAARRLRVTGRS